MADNLTPDDHKRLFTLLSPAYLWLTVAIFLPLSAMLFFSFVSDMPGGDTAWHLTLENYREFVSNPTYFTLLRKSLLLATTVTLICLLIGFPCALVLAKSIKGRSREALFLLVILPFWSNSLVRIFSWAIVLRGNGVLELGLNAVLPFDVRLNLMFTTTAIIIGLVHSYLPYVILTSYLALQAISDDVIDAARTMGASPFTILRRLLIPLSATGLIAGATLVFVPIVGSFMEPRILGGRVGTYYGTVIEDQFVAVYNWPLGAALSFLLLGVVLLILGLASPALKRGAV
ncbi:ABC transporter permease [Paracoccus albus]|uniref:ABC transporter permease n=1 Tax=Paracoccus albus TaxID=3017784 RepID=UPI0022F14026|nr:ABC transporter permease [Paracoccus albus]WBU62122.1 ABC transporter permease [Paracoccus albus]